MWFEQLRGGRTIRDGPVYWEEFKESFLDRIFSLQWREKKMVEFMNIRQGGMSVEKYSPKFTKLSKYAPAMVANLRARMIKF